MVAGPIERGSSDSGTPAILRLRAPFLRHAPTLNAPLLFFLLLPGVSRISASGGIAPVMSPSVPPPSEPLEGSALRR